MNKSILLSVIWCVIASVAMATQPVRRIRLQISHDSICSVSLAEAGVGHARDGFQCPSHFALRNTRAMVASSPDGLGSYGTSGRGVLPSIGEPTIPILMVEFQDVAFRPTTTAACVDSLFNEPDFKINSMTRGSVRDYFRDQSYGKFTPRFEVVGRVQAKNNRAYYGENANGSMGVRISELYNEVLITASEQGVDFRPFVKGRGVPLVVLFHAGPGEHDSFEAGREDYPWAHFSEIATDVSGIRFNSYFIGCELMQSYQVDETTKKPIKDGSGSLIVKDAQLEGIGVICHEMGHALGLPDFYSTSGVSTESPDYHDIMDYGQYAFDSYRPVGYSAYERNYLGWLSLEELKDKPEQKVLASLSDAQIENVPKGFIMRNPNNVSEYFVIENRQNSKWFSAGLGRGMLVYRIDYSANAWSYNRVNTDASRMRCVVLPADNAWQSHFEFKQEMIKSDFFPGIKNVVELTSLSHSAYRFNIDGKVNPIYNIQQEADGKISFSYIDPIPTAIKEELTTTSNNDIPVVLLSLDGRAIRADKAPAGVYLHRGKKIVLH